MVEQNRSGVYSQIVYAPTGNKLAIMSGQTLQKAFVPLIAGAQAVYTSAGLAYYRHPDWLGSSRLASTAGQSVYYEGAYAPFGESYAELGSTDRSFTGQNQGTVVGLYDFMFRQYSPVQGRWASPDPAGLAAVSAVNPQSWNRYGYVAGNPLNAVDPLGLVLKHSDLSTSSWWRPFGTSYASAYNAFGFFPGALSTIGGSWTFGVIEGSTIESNEYTSAGTWIEGSTLISVSNSYGWILTSSPGSAAFIGGTGGSWAKDFATALFWTFSAKSARQKGESFRDCVSRVRGAGGSFTTAVDAVSGVGAVNTALTARIGSTTYSVWRVWGGHGWAETTVTARNLSNLEAIATAAVGKGMIPPAWAAGAENWTAATAKVSGITTAVAVGLEGGTLGACTF